MSRYIKKLPAPKGEYTLKEIGQAIGGVSRARVAQIEARALEKLRAEAERRGLTLEGLRR